MTRKLFFIYGVACHLLFLLCFLYMAGFVGDLFVPKSIDSGPQGDLTRALLIDTLLIALFVIPHTIMARPSFKAVWTRIVPEPIERSTYVLFSCLLLILLMWQWQPAGTIIWDAQHPAARAVLYGLFAIGWLMVPLVSLLINHFDLFGTRQVWLHLQNREYTQLPLRVPSIYKRVRHPLYLGWMIAFWAIPTMTAGHLLFAVLCTGYMLVATWYEERNLVELHGDAYANYRRSVPLIFPRPWAKAKAAQDLLGDSSTTTA